MMGREGNSGNLALYIEPEPNLLGIGLAIAATVGMPILARVKTGIAESIGSPALKGDAALGIVYFLVREGHEAWTGEDCCCEDGCCSDGPGLGEPRTPE